LIQQKSENNTIELQPKKRLQIEGVDAELLRLLCRHMVNPKNQKAAERFWNAYLKSLQKSLF
jgi:hypothetical protein